jgi:hypothetical protein
MAPREEGRPAAVSSAKISVKILFSAATGPHFPRAACEDQESAWARNERPKSNFAEILPSLTPWG